ncbi:hypothetical protein V9K15_002427 [Vibrio cholerae]|nr:hypothetical protein [Vibrio cholerae]ELI9714501.1 hypothetical protein [Vibrio cholerae]BCN16950.1 putative O-antigen polymerase [Vibrio cholerae]BCN18291.1 putative O-antigen polymerase [Vibrio cholerae]GHX10457.1 hypothetical protein VCSRO156_1972 [Vibrio cholerae]
MAELLSVFLIFCLFLILITGRALVSYFLIICAVYSYISLIIFNFGFIVPFDLGSGLDKKFILDAIVVLAVSGISFSIGQMICYRRVEQKVRCDNVKRNSLNFNNVKSNFYAVIPIITGIFVILSVGPESLLIRDSYVVENANLTLRKYADITVWISILVIPFIKNKHLMFIVFLFLFLTFVGLGSRSAIVVGISYPLFNVVINNSSKLKALLAVFFVSIISISLMAVRFEYERGLIPTFSNIFNYSVDYSFGLYLFNYLTSYSTLLFAEYINSHTLSYKYFYMSLNPLPGFMLDIEGIDHWARFRKSIPHPAIAQLYSHASALILYFYFFFKGVVCGYVKRKIIISYGNSSFIVSSLIAVDLLFLIPVIRGMQYNLRSVARLEYFIFLLLLLLVFYLYLVRLKKVK